MLVAATALWLMVAPCSCNWFSDNSSDFWIATAGDKGLSFYKESDISTDNRYNFLSYESKKPAKYLDYDWSKKLLFMTTLSDTINVEPSDNPYVTSGKVTGARKGIAVDWLSNLIFLEVCDSNMKRCSIEMYNFQWENLDKVIDIDGTLHRLAVDPYDRIVFWLSLKHKDISAINYDSSEKRILLQKDDYYDKYIEMALDLANRRVFYVTQYRDKIRLESTDYGGEERTIYFTYTHQANDVYYGLGVYKDCAYWLAFDGLVQNERVYRIQLNDSNNRQAIISHPTVIIA